MKLNFLVADMTFSIFLFSSSGHFHLWICDIFVYQQSTFFIYSALINDKIHIWALSLEPLHLFICLSQWSCGVGLLFISRFSFRRIYSTLWIRGNYEECSQSRITFIIHHFNLKYFQLLYEKLMVKLFEDIWFHGWNEENFHSN